MKIPSVEEAEKLIEEAAKLNPGPWIEHNKTAGFCARTIAEKCNDMNPDAAYVMGLLHDIGRREGIEKRLVDVVIRRGFNDLTIPKWKAFLELKNYFDEKVGMDIYKLLNV